MQQGIDNSTITTRYIISRIVSLIGEVTRMSHSVSNVNANWNR